MEKEAELHRALHYLSLELGQKQEMTEEQLWDVFNICMDTSNVYRHITDYFTTLDKAILDARVTNSHLKQELLDLKHENNKLNKILDDYINEF